MACDPKATERAAASKGASVGASLGGKAGPFGAGIGAGLGGATGYIVGSCIPSRTDLVPDGGRPRGEGATDTGATVIPVEEPPQDEA